MSFRFTVRDWQAYAPGLPDKTAWEAWARAPLAPRGDAAPALADMPAMQRRRVEQLGRMALQVAYWCQPVDDADLPMVFASRHGDLSRTYAMLRELAKGEALSPTAFGLSTHNSIAAQYGIARRHTGQCQVVSAGTMTAEAGVVEALGLLAEGAAEVLVVVYDGAGPDAYRPFADEPAADFAWAVRLAGTAGPGVSLAATADVGAAGDEADDGLPHALRVLRFLIGTAPSLSVADGLRRWTWQRHG